MIIDQSQQKWKTKNKLGLYYSYLEKKQELFSDIGPIKRARFIDKGLAEVVYVRIEHAKEAIQKYDLKELDGMSHSWIHESSPLDKDASNKIELSLKLTNWKQVVKWSSDSPTNPTWPAQPSSSSQRIQRTTPKYRHHRYSQLAQYIQAQPARHTRTTLRQSTTPSPPTMKRQTN